MTDHLDADDLIALNRLTTVARVLAGAAHEVNNALQIIAGSAEMLGQQSAPGELSQRALQRIQAQTTRAAHTVGSVMQFARGDGAAAARVSLRSVAEKAVALRTYQLRRAGLTLVFEVSEAPAAPVEGRSGHLLQVALNLIMNAEQALAGGSGTISVELTESPEQVALIVSDSGPGVPPEMADRIFTPFATSHPVPDTPGLGLAVARLIARQHRGDVTVQSTRGGCRASLTLPPAGPEPVIA